MTSKKEDQESLWDVVPSDEELSPLAWSYLLLLLLLFIIILIIIILLFCYIYYFVFPCAASVIGPLAVDAEH
jgi:uncharacterized RDD family membrane protein YckC